MKKTILLLFAAASILQSCAKKVAPAEDDKQFKAMLDSYYQERMKLFPLESTTSGDSIYNNLLPNNLTDNYSKQVKAFFDKYSTEAKKYADDNLSENDRLSKELLLWECDINI